MSATIEVRSGKAVTNRGFTSTTPWLEGHAGLSTGESCAAVALGEKLYGEFTATRDAWLAGEIRAGAVRDITTVVPQKLKGAPSSGLPRLAHPARGGGAARRTHPDYITFIAPAPRP